MMKKRHLEMLGYHVLQVSRKITHNSDEKSVVLLIMRVPYRFLTLNGTQWSFPQKMHGKNIWGRKYSQSYPETLSWNNRLQIVYCNLILIAHFVISDFTYVTFFHHKEEMHSCWPLNMYLLCILCKRNGVYGLKKVNLILASMVEMFSSTAPHFTTEHESVVIFTLKVNMRHHSLYSLLR